MKLMNVMASSMIAASLLAGTAVFAADADKMSHMSNMPNMEKMVNMDEFMKSCDMDHDGMISKAEMLKHMEKMFDRMDTKKAGKLDRKQTEEFLKQFTAPSGS